MASLVSRLVACLVAVVAVLQLVHLVLLNKLESRRLTELHHLQNHPVGGEDHPRLGSIINGPQRLTQLGQNDVAENELLADRLLREEEGAIVDSGGEFRIVFNIAGPRPDAGVGVGSLGDGPGPPLLLLPRAAQQSKQTEDFSIDDENFESVLVGAAIPPDVTLVTQTDLENAKRFLLPLVQRWAGPISLALFASNSSQVDASLRFIAQARLCDQLAKQYVSFHLVFPLTETQQSGSNPNNTRLLTGVKRRKKRKPSYRPNPKECQQFLRFFSAAATSSSGSSSSSSNNDLSPDKGLNYDGRVYPVNLLRNVARKRVMTEFSFVTDVDMLPSTGLRSKFQRFAQDKQLLKSNGDERKAVYVLPAFESKNDESPGNKRELLALIDKYEVRPFYFDLCWKCQVHTDYETWQRERGSKTDMLSVLFEVLWKDPWEPFFISDNSVPLFDERFRQYGFNRISQLCELHVAGYKFAVLNDAFLIHRGYKTPQSFHSGRNRDLEMNRLNFRQFKNELKDKYPHSTRRCY